MNEYDKGLKDAVIELTAAMHSVDEAQKKMKEYGVTSFLWDCVGSGKGFPPRVILKNGIKELADIMGAKVTEKPDWTGRKNGLRCMTHGVRFEQDTKMEVEHYEPRRVKDEDR